MAIQEVICAHSAPVLERKLSRSFLAPAFLCIGLAFLLASITSAQTTTQQYVYLSLPGSPSSSISGFSKTAQTGALNALTDSPFSDRLEGGLVAIDGQGKFLFVLNPKSNDISMFQIDQVSGALTEVSGSPFAVPPTVNPNMAPSQPISITAESSGKFLFVGYLSGDFAGESAVVSLSIDTSGSTPALVTLQSNDLTSGGSPIQLLTDPKGLHLYIGLGANSMVVGGAEVYSIDPSTGSLGFEGSADSFPEGGLSYAIDPLDRFFFAGGRGASAGFLESCAISPVDGTNTCLPLLSLNSGDTPATMVAENSGQFLYVTVSQTTGDVVVAYSVNQTTGPSPKCWVR